MWKRHVADSVRLQIEEAAALSISAEGINKTSLNEAQTIWAINKIMGLHYKGDEKDLIRRFAIMEAEDEERAKGHASHHND
ncbi:hypothetical protein RHMOL_Rhmol13G0123300 [Rhododendron molle]|uniref:Uncharacterized protein n=1 Tax=Rhododendron molle TaxID=49168 RepID=A0ACC0L6I3_RHOML|nr:hypothetical protein RHMOL_Rhmol13G0123300 [Rhododendron molle]